MEQYEAARPGALLARPVRFPAKRSKFPTSEGSAVVRGAVPKEEAASRSVLFPANLSASHPLRRPGPQLKPIAPVARDALPHFDRALLAWWD